MNIDHFDKRWMMTFKVLMLPGTNPYPISSLLAGMGMALGGQHFAHMGGGMDNFQDTERRSSSIAALRLKAQEHSAAMHGILSAFAK